MSEARAQFRDDAEDVAIQRRDRAVLEHKRWYMCIGRDAVLRTIVEGEDDIFDSVHCGAVVHVEGRIGDGATLLVPAPIHKCFRQMNKQ